MSGKYKFGVQVVISGTILFFCIFQISTKNNTDTAAYWGQLSAILAYWLPSPSESDSDEN